MRNARLLVGLLAALESAAQEPAPAHRAAALEVEVVAPRLQPPAVAAFSDTAAGALGATPGVTVHSQGGGGAQSDLSIRGSSFSGAGLSLGGLSLRNPQTEHHHAEMPLPPAMLTAPRVLTGLEQAVEADGHLVGTVESGLTPVTGREGRLSAGAGQFDRYWLEALVREPLGRSGGDGSSGVALFGGHETAGELDYADNDLSRTSGGAQWHGRKDGARADLLVAAQHKEFGARGYYGVRPDWYADEELDDLLVYGSVGTTLNGGASRARLSASWRDMQDEYRLYWTLPGVYANRHISRTAQVFADGRAAASDTLALDWRAGIGDERLESNALGDHDRQRGLVSAVPEVTAGPVTAQAGVRGEVFTDDEPALLPVAGARWRAAHGVQPYASYTESVRQPSYTELNYDSPGSLGNSGLERQTLQAGEAGVAGAAPWAGAWRIAGFMHRSRHTVDWVKATPADTRFVATDLGTVDTWGAEAQADAALGDSLRMAFGYAWLQRDFEEEYHAGRYVVDYPEQVLQWLADWRIGGGWSLGTVQALRCQVRNPERTSDRFGADGRLLVSYAPAFWRTVSFQVVLDNMWNDQYQAFAGLPVADRRASAGMTLRW